MEDLSDPMPAIFPHHRVSLGLHKGLDRLADVADRLGIDQVIELRKAIVHARRTQGPLDMTLRLTMADGEIRWVTLQGRYDPHNGQPRLLGLIIVCAAYMAETLRAGIQAVGGAVKLSAAPPSAIAASP